MFILWFFIADFLVFAVNAFMDLPRAAALKIFIDDYPKKLLWCNSLEKIECDSRDKLHIYEPTGKCRAADDGSQNVVMDL